MLNKPQKTLYIGNGMYTHTYVHIHTYLTYICNTLERNYIGCCLLSKKIDVFPFIQNRCVFKFSLGTFCTFLLKFISNNFIFIVAIITLCLLRDYLYIWKLLILCIKLISLYFIIWLSFLLIIPWIFQIYSHMICKQEVLLFFTMLNLLFSFALLILPV